MIAELERLRFGVRRVETEANMICLMFLNEITEGREDEWHLALNDDDSSKDDEKGEKDDE